MSSAVIKYIGEKGDPPGKWVVEIALTDKVRGTIIPLKTQFNLLNEKANLEFERDANLPPIR